MRFVKGHGTQNDFVLLPDLDGGLDLTPDLVTALCDRRAGVGGDGVMRVVRTAAVPQVAHLAGDAEFFMDYHNADGSVAEMCGNGVRVYARFLVAAGLVPPGELQLATRGGLRGVRVPAEGDVTVDMGRPEQLAANARVTVAGTSYDGVAVSMGNPHLVVAVPDLAAIGDLRSVPVVTPREAFPQGVNVEFVELAGPGRIAMRVHERGVGETRACGTGACAAAVAAATWWGGEVDHEVDLPGGLVRVRATPAGTLLLSGPAVLVAEGEVHLEALSRPVVPVG